MEELKAEGLAELDKLTAGLYAAAAAERHGSEKYDDAIQYLDQAIKLCPRNASYFNARGNAKYALQNYKESGEDYTKAKLLDGKNSVYFQNCGGAKYALGSHKEAIENYSRAIDLAPSEPENFNYRANTKYSSKDNRGALADYQQAIALGRKKVANLKLQAENKYKSKDYKGAADVYREVFALEVGSISVYFRNCGVVEQALGEHRDAMVSFSCAIEYDPNDSSFFKLRGKLKGVLNDWHGALADYEESTELAKNDAECFHERGDVEYRLGFYDKAKVSYSRATQLAPQKASYFNELGEVLFLQLKDYKGALVAYKKAVELSPKNIDFLVNRALIHKKLGMIAECIQDFKSILSIDSNYSYANYTLGKMVEKGELPPAENEGDSGYFKVAYESYCARKAKKTGDSAACYRLGKMFEFGRGVDKDSVKATELYQESVKLNGYAGKKSQQRLDKLNTSAIIKKSGSAGLIAKFDGGAVHSQQPTVMSTSVDNNNNNANLSAVEPKKDGPSMG